MNVRHKLAASWLILTLLPAVNLTGQTHKSAVRGRVVDGSGAPVPGASIGLQQLDTDDSRTTRSGAEGEFSLTSLLPGPYRLVVELAGYKKHIRHVILQVNQTLQFDVPLEIGTLAQEIVVNASRIPVRRDSAALGTVIENRQVTGLPLDGRNFLELSLLVPGAVIAAPGSAGSVRGEFAFNVNGAREDSNNFLLDGVFNVDPKLNTLGVKPPVDAIREFELLNSTYDAAFGRNPGSQVNVVLKSGTNQLHGTAYEFLRNRALDARNYFAPSLEPAPQYQRNQFGFSLGGPIRKDRTFFFGDYEGTRVREGLTRVTNVPTQEERVGDFSRSAFAKPIDPFTQMPFSGGQIPLERQNPIGRAIAALYPLPNRSTPFQNYVSSPTLRDRGDLFDVRLDHATSPSSLWAVRYSFSDGDLLEPFSGPAFAQVPGFGTRIPRRAQNLMVSQTQILSPQWVNEARFAFNRVAAGAFHQTQGTSLNQRVGLPELSANPRDFGLSFITLTGFSPIGDEFNNPQHTVSNTFQVVDNASYAKGRHLLKLGFELRGTQQNGFRDVQSRGFLTFSSQAPITGNALGDLLLGLPALTGGARLDNHQYLRTESYSAFIHDSFRLSSRLTLSVGTRYELNSPPVDILDRANLYDPASGNLVAVGRDGVPRGGYRSDRNNWAPRAGIAWSPSQGTVIRTGYGIYYDQSSLAPGEGLYFNPPYFDFNLYFSLPGLPLTLYNPFPQFFPLPLPDSAFFFQRDLRTAYMQHWNLSVQQELGQDRIVELAYVGSKGTRLVTARDFNQPRPSPLQPNLRPNPFFDDINILESRGNSNYHSLQARLQQNYASGLSLLASYAWSRSIDDASNFFSSSGDPNFPQDSHNVRAERGRSNFDVRHRLSFSYSYDLPVGRGHRLLGQAGWLTMLLSGWQTFGIVTIQAGRPFTVALLSEIDNSNTGRSSLGFGANDRPNVVANPKLETRTPERWFDTEVFRFPAYGSFGNAGRNILEGPGLQNINASLLKNTPLTESMSLQLRVEAFNLFNRPNFDLPDIFLGSPTFGRIQSARSPRHIQFGLKLIF
ncbi:MAG: TonB-dependent receptor [Acidobacteriota bacterium]